jgi:hypothetical protein
MQKLGLPEIRRNQTAAPAGPPATFAEMRGLRTTARSLPEWAVWRARWSGSKVEIGSRQIPVLPENIPDLTDVERGFIERRVRELDDVVAVERGLVIVDEDVAAVTADQAKLILVTKMLMAKASAAMSPEGAAAKGESYMTALHDLPAWAVEQAIAEWYRGEVPGVDPADFKWSPDSSALRRIAKDAVRHYADLMGKLKLVLAAKHLSEIGA